MSAVSRRTFVALLLSAIGASIGVRTGAATGATLDQLLREVTPDPQRASRIGRDLMKQTTVSGTDLAHWLVQLASTQPPDSVTLLQTLQQDIRRDFRTGACFTTSDGFLVSQTEALLAVWACTDRGSGPGR